MAKHYLLVALEVDESTIVDDNPPEDIIGAICDEISSTLEFDSSSPFGIVGKVLVCPVADGGAEQVLQTNIGRLLLDGMKES